MFLVSGWVSASANITEGCGLLFKHPNAYDWAEWVESVEKDTASVYLKTRSRTCLHNGHITAPHTMCNGAPFETVTHLKFIQSAKLWKNAKNTCANQGGLLFGDLDGTQQQIEFLVGKLNNKDLFLGAKAKDSKWDWRTLDNKDIRDKIIWHWGQQSEAKKGQVLLITNNGGQWKCKSGSGTVHKRPFACDMR